MFSSLFELCCRKRLRLFGVFVFLCMSVSTQPVHAQVATLQELSFGEFISARNDAQYNITVNLDGSYSFSSGAFFEIVPPSVGIYEFTGLAGNATVTNVSITQTSSLISGGAPAFELINFQNLNSSVTNLAGVLQVRVAGTARTSGNGLPYPDRTYEGGINIALTLEVN